MRKFLIIGALTVIVSGLRVIPGASAAPRHVQSHAPRPTLSAPLLVNSPLARKVKAHGAGGPYTAAWENASAKISRWAATGRLYADWQCDVGGTIVATGIWWVWLSNPATATGALGEIAFTVGCHMSADYNRAVASGYYSGVPHEIYDACFMVFPHGNRSKKQLNCIA